MVSHLAQISGLKKCAESHKPDHFGQQETDANSSLPSAVVGRWDSIQNQLL